MRRLYWLLRRISIVRRGKSHECFIEIDKTISERNFKGEMPITSKFSTVHFRKFKEKLKQVVKYETYQ